MVDTGRSGRVAASSVDGLVERSAAPADVRLAIDRVSELHPDLLRRLEGEQRLAEAFVAVTAASRSSTRTLETDPDALEVLGALDRPVEVSGQTPDDVAAAKRRELIRIASRDLLGLDDLPVTVELISGLARECLQAATQLAEAPGLAVIGMGKLGGNELNYASDVDVMFAGDGEPRRLDRAARNVMNITRRCFRVDANLRPEGRNGQLVRSVDSYEAYWDRWAEPWEFQALLKARPAAGDRVIGQRFADAAGRWLWTHPFSSDDLRSVRALKLRSEQRTAERGLAERDVKQGRGGIRDIEFAVQLLQLVHGHVDADLRTPTTLDALRELSSAGYIDEVDADQLCEAYVFLRRVEHRLQLVDEQQTQTVPEDPAAVDHLARVMGLRDTGTESAAEAFGQELRQHMLAVRLIHERLYFRPLLEAFAGLEGSMTPEDAETRLEAFGFTDAKRTKAAVRELTRGLNRSSRLMQQLLPLLLDWLSTSPDPDLGLLLLRNVLTGEPRRSHLLEAFRESPEVARRLCAIFGTSRLVGDLLIHNPDVIARLADVDRLRTRPREELVDGALAASSWRSEQGERQQALRRWHDRHLIGVTVRDLFDAAEVAEVGTDLTRLAEATLEAALDAIDPQVPFAVVALGRFGGAQLSYASDLDVVFVYDGERPSDFAEAERVAKGLARFVAGTTPAERIYTIDADLRPEGKQGPLARSVEGYATYYDRWAEVWERQAWLRARPVAGDLAIARTLLDTVRPFVWGDGLTAEEAREIRRLKARMEAERIPVGEDPKYHMKLGRGGLSDIEWTAQLLQLEHGVEATGTIAALNDLRDRGLMSDDDAACLIETYVFLEHTRNRLYLVRSTPGDALPNKPEELMWLARSLGTDAGGLREDYKRHTRRSRRVFERLFYAGSES